jgi:hypothetical protein
MFKVDNKVFFPYAGGGQQSFGGQKNHFLGRFGLRNFIFLFLVELGTCLQRQFFDNKKGIWKIDVLKIQMVSTYLSASFTYRIFFWKKIKISNFGSISMFLKLIVFGQISALLGGFFCICSG